MCNVEIVQSHSRVKKRGAERFERRIRATGSNWNWERINSGQKIRG